MKRIVSSLLVSSLAVLHAKEAVLKGGTSPDGKYEVVVEGRDIADSGGTPLPDVGYGYQIHVRDAKTKKRLFTLPDTGGYLDFAAARDRGSLLWHASGGFVAITEQSSRHGVDTYLVAMNGGRPMELKLPDYVRNALGKVRATEVGMHSISTALKWAGNDLVMDFKFSANAPTEGSRFFKTQVTLTVVHGPQQVPSVKLKAVTPPEEFDP